MECCCLLQWSVVACYKGVLLLAAIYSCCLLQDASIAYLYAGLAYAVEPLLPSPPKENSLATLR
ncbi:MAG: hypothetical protein ACRC9X_06065 [Bacteroidales bacterium]